MSIYALRRKGIASGYQNWYWERSEAMSAFHQQVEDYPQAVVEVFELDAEHLITDVLTEALDGKREDVDVDRIAIFDGANPIREEAVWGELEYRPEGYFYIERTKASTSEYWPFNVEPYNGPDNNKPGQWRLIDGTTDVPMAIIRHTDNAFKVTVNGYSRTEVFTNLKGAVIYAVNEFNG